MGLEIDCAGHFAFHRIPHLRNNLANFAEVFGGESGKSVLQLAKSGVKRRAEDVALGLREGLAVRKNQTAGLCEGGRVCGLSAIAKRSGEILFQRALQSTDGNPDRAYAFEHELR